MANKRLAKKLAKKKEHTLKTAVQQPTAPAPTKEIEENAEKKVPRSFKNMNGVYETDFINCTLWEEKAKIAKEYCKTGDIVGIRGRLQSNIVKTDEGTKYYLEVVADKVSFLSNRKKENVKNTDK